jgi:drug/metabolite transporter (DMT)-like permease
MTAVGIWYWEPMARGDWLFMLALCISGVAGHWLMIRCYEVAEASAVQPFAYLHLIFIAFIGVLIFGETVSFNVIAGATIIVLAGLFTFWRESLQR